MKNIRNFKSDVDLTSNITLISENSARIEKTGIYHVDNAAFLLEKGDIVEFTNNIVFINYEKG